PPPTIDIGRSEFEPDRSPLDPTVLVPKGKETSTRKKGSENDLVEEYFDNNPIADREGGPGFDLPKSDAPPLGGASLDLRSLRTGPALTGMGGIGAGGGHGNAPGNGGKGTGFGFRNQGSPVRHGTNKSNEVAVALALNWLARHQNRDGSWSLTQF